MLDYKSKNCPDKNLILDDLIKTIMEIAPGGEMQFEQSIGPQTLFRANLAFKSIHLAKLVAAIQRIYNRQDLPFQEFFMPNNQPVQDLRVLDLVDFLHKHLNHP